jgi:hypothetical protein
MGILLSSERGGIPIGSFVSSRQPYLPIFAGENMLLRAKNLAKSSLLRVISARYLGPTPPKIFKESYQ